MKNLLFIFLFIFGCSKKPQIECTTQFLNNEGDLINLTGYFETDTRATEFCDKITNDTLLTVNFCDCED